MFVSRSIPANHADLIHDVAYDFYGLRMATCSSDQMIKIWDLRPDGEWVCTARWRCHLGSAWRVTWAHPEFGQVIATCSFDRTIAIWEEIVAGQSAGGAPLLEGDGQPGLSNQILHSTATPFPSTTNWVRRASLVDPRTSVTDLQFAPRHLGLQLAAISTDGLLRIYEALDVMNLSQWRLQFDFGTKMNGSCLAWSQSRLDPPLIAVGSATPASLNTAGEIADGAPAPPTGNMFQTGLGGSGGSSGSLVVGKVVIYEYSEARRHWDLVEDIGMLVDAVYDLQFAPHMGQSFHTLAVGSKEVFILRIRPTTVGQGNNIVSKGDVCLSGSGSLSSMPAPNVTGSVLASSGDDGYVRLWQANHLGVWQPISVIAPDGSLPTGSTDYASAVTLTSMIPQLPPPVRNLGNVLQLKSNVHTENETVKSSFDRQGAVPTSIFLKPGTFASGNHPVAWH
ncbi:Nucleoporin seh1 A [Paragonimus heterotremus]|uniref:Nucleoporin seh1 A n=1 Tax=Paragonimus heterotremus TaxID=100268 RepID=A0A8J4X2K7_9TREM|nr:Nucleoporin seh1 A [Paragonimus heterotremus]